MTTRWSASFRFWTLTWLSIIISTSSQVFSFFGCQVVGLSFSFSVVSVCPQSCPTLCNPVGCSPPGSSVHGISQARILEWVAISFSKGSSQPGNWTHISCIVGRRFFTTWAIRALSFSSPCFLTIPGARSLRSGCQQGWFLLRLLLACGRVSLFVFLWSVLCVCLDPNLLFYKETSHVRLGPAF